MQIEEEIIELKNRIGKLKLDIIDLYEKVLEIDQFINRHL